MKKITSVAFAFLSTAALAQLPVSTSPQNKKAVLEEFTGIYCQHCPDGHKMAANMKAADPNNVFLMNIHTGGYATVAPGEQDFKTPEGDAIRMMPGMNVTGYPTGSMNREVLVGSAMAASRSAWNSMANTIKSQQAYCNVAMQATINPQTRVITVACEVYYTANSPTSTNYLSVFLLENNVRGKQIDGGNYYPQNYNADGTYNHQHVLRKAISPTFGQLISQTTQGSLFTTTLTYTIPATYGAAGKTTVPNLENLELLAFVNQTDAKIINACTGPIFLTNDAKAISAAVTAFNCGTAISPAVTVKNNGLSTITDLTITPAVDNIAASPFTWSGILAPGASTAIVLSNVPSTVGGGHALTYTITGVAPADFLVTNNTQAKLDFYSATGFQATPVAEGFILGKFPPTGWGINNANAGSAWTRNTQTGGYYQSFNAAKYDFFNNTVLNDVDEFYMPPMNLAGTAVPNLTFDYAYAQRDGLSNDQLEVFVSDDCGATWTSLWMKSGLNLATAPQSATAYLPDPADFGQWTTVMLPLTGLNLSNVVVKFVTTNDNGNNLYLDNINLSQSMPVGIANNTANQSMVALYPNPASETANLSIYTAERSQVNVVVYNAMGQISLQKTNQLEAGQNNVALDLRQLAPGFYSVFVEGDNISTTKKLTISK